MGSRIDGLGTGRQAGDRWRERGALRGDIVTTAFEAQVDRWLAVGNFHRVRRRAQVRGGPRLPADDLARISIFQVYY